MAKRKKEARPESPKFSLAHPDPIMKTTYIEEPTATGFIRHTIGILFYRSAILSMTITGRQEFKTVKAKQGRARK
jgi:hypothetical protein